MRGDIFIQFRGPARPLWREALSDFIAERRQAAMGAVGRTLPEGQETWVTALTGLEPLFLEASHPLQSVFLFAKRAK